MPLSADARRIYDKGRQRRNRRGGGKGSGAARRARLLTIVALDGEGAGAQPHRYVYLAAVDELGALRGEVRSWDRGLTTVECLDLLLSLGSHRVFGFSLGYDVTKWLQDLPDKLIYELVRPELRTRIIDGHRVIMPRHWRGFRLNYLRGKLVVRRARLEENPRRWVPYGPSVVVWDVWRFYQGSFVKALKDWKVGSDDELARIESMKKRRARFRRSEEGEIEGYCRSECSLLATLIRRLCDAHEAAGLVLRSFYGAGSTSSAMLDLMNVRASNADPPEKMYDALARSFFGGRFENARVGVFRGDVYGGDISSAYVYQLWRLPCLIHGRWSHVTSRRGIDAQIRRARVACVACRVVAEGRTDWAPLPWRAGPGGAGRHVTDHSIVFPRAVDRTWVWQDEYAAARAGWEIDALEAWTYHTDCDCRPFARVAEWYRERCRIGKDGPGIVLKLGLNGGYGKLAQRVGQPRYRSPVWASLVTSGTRAALLEVIAPSPPWSVLGVATDGYQSSRELAHPVPVDTGTSDTGKPLGGWERSNDGEPVRGGMFLARPGIHFPLDPKGREKTRARGISRDVLGRHADRMIAHLAKEGAMWPYTIVDARRFVGMRTGVQKRGAAEEIRRSRDYGEWCPVAVDVSFAPWPKRERIDDAGRMHLWRAMPGESAPYKGIASVERLRLEELKLVLEESEGELL